MTPSDIEHNLHELGAMLLSLNTEDKKTLKDCLVTGSEPPPRLSELLEAVKDALKAPEKQDAIQAALDADGQHFFLLTRKQYGQPESADEYAKTQISLCKLLRDDIKDSIAAAIKDPKKRDTLGDALSPSGYIWKTICDLLTFPNDYRQQISDVFHVPITALDGLKAEALKHWYIGYTAEKEEYIPGLEPTPEEHRANYSRYPAPTYIYPQYTMIPTAELARNIHNLEFQDTEAGTGAIAKVGIDRRPHSKFVYMLMLDKLAEQYPITAGDKNILIALGNLYGERLNQPGGKGIQGGSIITAADIIRRYRGLDATDRIDPQTIDEVTRRMAYLMKMRVSFDFSQHFEYRKKDIGDGEEVELAIPDNMRRIDAKTGTVIRFSYIGQMVHANTIEAEYDSGRIETAWEILTPPIVFDYAQKIKQVATIETRLLDLRRKAKASTNNTAAADVMKIYLIERINAMIDPKTHRPKDAYSQTITLATLFEDLRIEIANRKTKKMKIDMARDILEHFKETPDKHRGRFIKGYEVVKGYRGAVTGFEILF